MSRRITEKKYDLPMNKHASSAIEALLYEIVSSGKVLEDVLVFHVIHLD